MTHEAEVTDSVWEPEQTVYFPLDEAEQLEDIEQYRPGGFHPVAIDDFLGENDRFDVWSKLGQGGHGIVWLCHDREKNKFCAVKVLRADISEHKEFLGELRIKDMLAGVSVEKAWENHIVTPHEVFWETGPNGKHLCIVTPVLGPDISASRARNFDDTKLLKDICFQLTEGLAYLHDHGICHGDFRTENILFKTTLADLSPGEMGAYISTVQSHNIWQIGADDPGGPHAPDCVYEPVHLELKDRYISKDIAIIDFGTAFPTSLPSQRSLIPQRWAAPEVQPEINDSPGIGSDLWSLGCTIAQVIPPSI